MKLVVNHPVGNANVRAALSGLYKAELLAEFHTSIAVFKGGMLDKSSEISFLTELKRRYYSSNLKKITRVQPWSELGRLSATKMNLKKLIKHEQGIFCIDNVYFNLDCYTASRLEQLTKLNVKGVYAYEDGAINSFHEAKRLGIRCLYDLPIGYWRAARRFLEAEQDRWPAWTSTLTSLIDSPAKLERKDEELRLAEHIFVASKFTAKTLQEFPGHLAPVEIIPYGFPPVVARRQYGSTKTRPLKLLFVGGLSQRKGIANLFAAVDAIGSKVSLTVVGRKANDECSALNISLAKHQWIPSLSHKDILQLMQEHDVLVFPSLFEGFGLVITEAMSQGTPVITTERTAGPDLIEHGYNGWLVEAGSTSSLQAAIEELLYKPKIVRMNGMAAIESAKLRPWEVYGQELATAIMKYSL